MSLIPTDKYHLIRADAHGLLYIGINNSNPTRSALLIPWQDIHHDSTLYKVIRELVIHQSHISDTVCEIDGRIYYVYEWTDKFDQTLVDLVDALVSLRMLNKSRMEITLQLELPV